jgi:hypothetical protein
MNDGIAKSGGRFAKTFLVFSLLGSIVSGLVPNLLMLIVVVIPVMINVHGPGGAMSVLFAASTIFLIGMLYAVLLAVPSSVLTGLAVGAWEYFKGRIALWLVALIGLIAGLAWIALYLWLGLSPEEAREFYSPEIFIIVAGSVIASICCWWLVRPKTKAA